jgi:hypothetical protein
MKQFTLGVLPGFLQERPVMDKTDCPVSTISPSSLTWFQVAGANEAELCGPSPHSLPLPKVLEEQLGLRLAPAKVPVEFLIIDHIEKATENCFASDHELHGPHRRAFLLIKRCELTSPSWALIIYEKFTRLAARPWGLLV